MSVVLKRGYFCYVLIALDLRFPAPLALDVRHVLWEEVMRGDNGICVPC